MNIALEPGKYVVAVSGGVDSVTLLHLLRSDPKLKLIVAHFDHGIRPESVEDRRFVAELAKQYSLPFVYATGNLGPEASEAAARKARYAFLRKIQNASRAQAIITAHHQDDLLETAILNLVRGTHRRGLTSLKSSHNLVRPLLHLSKQDIKKYAEGQGLMWREDVTNSYQKYLRNHIRHSVVANMTPAQRKQLLEIIKRMHELNDEMEGLLINMLHLQSAKAKLDRQWYAGLGHAEAREVMAAWLRARGIKNYDRSTLERLTVGAKVTPPGKSLDVINGARIKIEPKQLALTTLER